MHRYIAIALMVGVPFLQNCQPERDGDRQPTLGDADTTEEISAYDPEFIRQWRSNYIENYSIAEARDSTLKLPSGDIARIMTRHYCLFDNGLVVAPIYVWEDTTREFITHNYAFDISITVSGKPFFKRTITKADFFAVLPTELQQNATLFTAGFSGFDSESGSFKFGFSVTIPGTDIGQHRTIIVSEDKTWIALEK